MRLVLGPVLAVALLAGCATIDSDECRKGDRRRCPGEASDTHREGLAGRAESARIPGAA